MTATDELRRLLDERGVEWWPLGSDMTECVVDGVRIKYRQVGRGLIVLTCTEGTLTPEQAIAATLGVGACHADKTETWQGVCISNPIRYVHNLTIHVMECSACGGTYEYVNGSYEYCPRCGAKVVVE